MSATGEQVIQGLSMFFAGLILLIPHRIGMSRVNYVIKRYNLPISRAGLLLYKFHNPIEVSLTIGTLLGNIIVWSSSGKPKSYIGCCFITFCGLMLTSSIIMYSIYITGDDYGHLDHFYFSLILITLFDGFVSAFAFAINWANAGLYALGIPTSGALVSILHNIYEYHSFKNGLEDFDYHVLRVQLLINILTLLATIILWAATFWNYFGVNPISPSNSPWEISPICMLAFSLGTVYAFYPSIAPYSIIDYQYVSVIELWILVISAIPPIVIAVLDHPSVGKGPGGQTKFLMHSIEVKVKHAQNANKTHGGITCSHYKQGNDTTNTNAHDYGKYTLTTGDKYKDANSTEITLDNLKPQLVIINNWFWGKRLNPADDTHLTDNNGTYYWWCMWFCIIPYILCIQIFMSMLHYPDCLLSCFFNNNPFRIGFISVLFNTVRETMQACGFSGAGKQYYNSTSSNKN